MHIPIKLLVKIIKTYTCRITLKRVWNLVLTGISMFLSKMIKKPIVWGSPALLMVEPTNFCNLKCPLCPSGAGEMKRPQGYMDVEKFKDVIDAVGDKLILIQFWNQGEPFLHKAFLGMIAYAKSRHIPVMTSTNGHFIQSDEQAEAIVQSGLDEVLISIDGLDQNTYKKYRVGGKYETVLQGVRNLIQAKEKLQSKRPLITLQFLMFKHNQHQADQMLSLGRQLNVDVVALKSAQIYSNEQGDSFLPDNEDFRRYEKVDNKYHLKGKLPNWCKFLWYGAVLNWDGCIVPCCFDKDAEFYYGNVFQSIPVGVDIWKGDRALAFRQNILNHRNHIPICNNCFEGIDQSYVKYSVMDS